MPSKGKCQHTIYKNLYISVVWPRGRLEQCRTRAWDLVQHGMRKLLQVRSRVAEAAGNGARYSAEDERSGKGRQGRGFT